VPDQYAAEMINADGSSSSVIGPMQVNRVTHTATLLTCPNPGPCEFDGQVLIAGGQKADNSGFTTTAELFDTYSGSFISLGAGTSERASYRAVRLNSGAVMLVGGVDHTNNALATADIYDPGGQHFTAANIVGPRAGLVTALLTDGRVLIAGGYGASQTAWDSGEIFDPAADAAPAAFTAVAYSFSVSPAGAASYTIVGGSLPPNLTLNTTTGQISGSPTADGVFPFMVGATDAGGRTTYRRYVITAFLTF
jgi:hypothetical protein